MADISGINLQRKYSLKEVMDGLENIEGENFVSSAIYRVCLPKNARSLKQKAEEEETLITHVMFEARMVEFLGENAIAVYMRDKTHYAKMKLA